MVEGYFYDKAKLPSFGVSLTNSGNYVNTGNSPRTRISPRNPENVRPPPLDSIHINDMKQFT